MGIFARISAWAVFGAVLVMSVGTPPVAQAQVLSTTDTVVVVDAIGTVVGPASGGFSGGGGNAIIAFQVDPFVVAMVATRSRGLLAATFDPLWESNDCMGPPLMNVNQSGGFSGLMFSPAMVVSGFNPGQDVLGKVRVADPNDVTPELVTIRSQLDSGFPKGCIDLAGNSFQATVVDTLEIIDLDALFTPPFHVEVMGEAKKGNGPKK